MNFQKEYPPVAMGADISLKSFEIITHELQKYPKIHTFNKAEQALICRLIHTTTCFDEVLENIYFSADAIERIKSVLQKRAKIIVDVSMIHVGLSNFYLNTYENEVVCYINEPFTHALAQERKTTRSYAAVSEAIQRHQNEPMVFVCGNAPTFIYAAINTLLDLHVKLENVCFVLFPVGFVNVIESKEYAKRFCEQFKIPLVMMQGRFGGSTMAVAALHAIYKAIEDFDGVSKYNGK
ncbi:precorrin-8X methylmutase [Sulfurospirillum barnesii]|uniref:Precorrin isomerase n=1 Tax=Sulfurospirillum barnesii (strain ATCC 700032 / DSM 10660 / SES-3) TaxID=760154 RepID=I3XZM6_SULBS|nr:precorrin-8X methylmutase [Sulfurospirillum barnesii]AFL69400.1 precorrin isomerase [Sulfurospirillum barnesii SES-3]